MASPTQQPAPASPDVSIEVSARAPIAYQDMLWSEFFASRGRGLTLRAHFPWLAHVCEDVRYAVASEGEELVGGLALRTASTTSGRIGSIGLVCVHPDHRGRGISTALLDTAIDTARSLGLAALRLWTQKPAVYARVGFEIADQALFGSVRRPGPAPQDEPSTDGPRPTRHDLSPTCGIPPFATAVEQVTLGGATLTLVHDSRGPIVSGWQGDDTEVAALMSQVLPAETRFNAFAGQALLELLAARGWQLSLAPSRLQMILPLDGRPASDWAATSWVPVTDRL